MAKNKSQIIEKSHLVLKAVKPLTSNQQLMFDHFEKGFNLLCAGSAGTGKTFLSLYLGLSEMDKTKKYHKLIIVRSSISSRDQGFLPGSLAQKQAVFEAPYIPIVNDLYGRGDAYGLLKSKGVISFETTSYIRGLTWSDCIVIIDEVQNMTIEEIGTIITRLGKNTRVIICGDSKQSDMEIGNKRKEQTGFFELFKTIQRMNCFKTISFSVEDIVRSGIVKAWLLARHELEDNSSINDKKNQELIKNFNSVNRKYKTPLISNKVDLPELENSSKELSKIGFLNRIGFKKNED